MKIRFIISLFCLVFLVPGSILAQELKCNIQIVSQQIQGTNRKVFETLQGAIYEFMNNRSWTNHVFTPNERIECNMLINLTEQRGDEFVGTIQVQSRRPVFNSAYNTVMLNYMDNNFNFRYVEFETLEYSDNSFVSNLTSMLAFYAYVILGLDYDSYSPRGGTEFLQKAEQIVNNAQNARERGWKAFEASSNRNRYWLIQNLMDSKYGGVRDFVYQYHRQGLDLMSSKTNEARVQIAESLSSLQQIYRAKPDPYMHLLQVIFDAKSDEWINVFTESFPEEKNRVVQVLKEIDPANMAKYNRIIATGT